MSLMFLRAFVLALLVLLLLPALLALLVLLALPVLLGLHVFTPSCAGTCLCSYTFPVLLFFLSVLFLSLFPSSSSPAGSTNEPLRQHM